MMTQMPFNSLLVSVLPVKPVEHLSTGCKRMEPVTLNHKGDVSDLNWERWDFTS